MTKTRELKLTPLLLLIITLGLVSVAVVKTTGQDVANVSDKVPSEQWEYWLWRVLALAILLRQAILGCEKEPNVPFGREAFVLEQHLDKLGAKW